MTTKQVHTHYTVTTYDHVLQQSIMCYCIWIMVHTSSSVFTRTCLGLVGRWWSCYIRMKYGCGNDNTHGQCRAVFTIQSTNAQLYAHQSTTHVTLTSIPDVVTTPLELHVMEDGWLAAPEGGVSVETWSNSKSFMSQRLV